MAKPAGKADRLSIAAHPSIASSAILLRVVIPLPYAISNWIVRCLLIRWEPSRCLGRYRDPGRRCNLVWEWVSMSSSVNACVTRTFRVGGEESGVEAHRWLLSCRTSIHRRPGQDSGIHRLLFFIPQGAGGNRHRKLRGSPFMSTCRDN